MRQFLSIAVLILLWCAPTETLARGGGGHLSGTGHVNPSNHSTHGYYRKDGTYVHPYHATNPNQTGRDNYSTKGNVNPWTRQPGSHYVDK
jgi:hypothetical protein